MVAISRSQAARALPLLIAILVVGVGAYFVCVSAIEQLQYSQAEYRALSFGKYLVQQVPDLAGIIDGTVVDDRSAQALSAIKPIGSVFKFRIFDENGNLKVDSSPFTAGHIVVPQNSFLDSVAQRVAQTNVSSFAIQRGDGNLLPVYYSEVIVPLMVGNRTIGTLAILTDQTEAWPLLLSQLQQVVIQVLALILIAFAVPFALYLRKHTQFEFTRRRLRFAAQHDALTGALNRLGFVHVLADQIEAARQQGSSVVVHMIDLDRFKDINEVGGHALGDEALKQVSARLEAIGTRSCVARLGADEFAILQPLPAGNSNAAATLAERITGSISQPFKVGGKLVQLSASVGYASFPADGSSGEEVMRAADAALHHAKVHNRGRAISFDRSMQTERQARHRIEARLRAALANDEFELHFQPVFEIATGQLRGFEALLRLDDGDGHPIPPSVFIPVAETLGLIGAVGLWALREACRAAQQWPDQLFVAVNLSPAQFTAAGMAVRVGEVLKTSGLQPQRLELEVTESLLITDTEKVMRELTAIKALGTTLALDDFGTGYSSLSYVWRFPFDKLKVDRSFMADLTVPGAKSREILATIIALGRVLNLKITAEGVETEAQAAVLRELNCDMVQGYLFGRPQRAADVAGTILKAFGASALASNRRSETASAPAVKTPRIA